MRNLIYHLKPRLYLPFKLMEKTTEANVEHFKVYIDESILYEQEEMMIARRFIVAFYTIKAKDIERLNCAYKQTIYANKATHEKKKSGIR